MLPFFSNANQQKMWKAMKLPNATTELLGGITVPSQPLILPQRAAPVGQWFSWPWAASAWNNLGSGAVLAPPHLLLVARTGVHDQRIFLLDQGCQ